MRKLAVIAALALLTASCGQLPGVHDNAVRSGEVPAGGLGPGTDIGADPGTDPGADPGSSPGAGGNGGGGGGGGVSPPPPGGGNTTGITATTIKIGIHAPLTGAAPISPTSFRTGTPLYWENNKVFGKNVQVVFEDDQYNPSHAKQVCQKMVEQDKVFLLLGGGGTDQVQSCARYAASVGVPYLSAGTTEVGIRGLDNYFAVSESYAQQGPQLAQYIKREFTTDAARVAMVVTDTPNFDDAVTAFTEAFPGVKVFRPAKNQRGGSMAGNLCTGNVKNYDVVYPLTAPTYYLEMAAAAQCHPQYAGVGITMGLDQVADTGCSGNRPTENGVFFSPAPAFADSNDYDPKFRQAGGSDDIMWLLWGLMKSLHQLFLETGEDLSRERFIAASESATVKTGVYPDVQYAPDDRFGAKQVHVLKNVCTGDGGHYVTLEAFKSSF